VNIRYDPDSGLVPAIVQHAETGEVLMLAYMNRAALEATTSTGRVHFWSRSRRALWQKGETSGNVLELVSIRSDCDDDTLLVEALPAGPTCHTGARTCFDPAQTPSPAPVGFARLEDLWETIAERSRNRPSGSYTTKLLEGGTDATGRKVLEEAAEVVDAAILNARDRGPADRIDEETADLIYHLLVLLAERGLTPDGALRVLSGRRG
jgi:phosphoribosyl-ATP pyrophosphohydrolase/phosphoribosyl-AMP cyclohydrolase